MRLTITLNAPKPITLPFTYAEMLVGVIYHALQVSDPVFAHNLHNEGFRAGSGQTFKLFVYSWLMASRTKIIPGQGIQMGPGPIKWHVSSPIPAFVQHIATGLLAEAEIRLGTLAIPIGEVDTFTPQAPPAGEPLRATCLSPIVAEMPMKDRSTYYVRPNESADFSRIIRNNLLRKHEILYGGHPTDDEFYMTFDPDYMARTNGGTKMIRFKDQNIVGAFAPFTASGSQDLIQVMLDCGAGSKNSIGFGMIAPV